MSRFRTFFSFLFCRSVPGAFCLLAYAFLSQLDSATALGAEPKGRTTVLWLSLDGFRHDYPDRSTGAFFAKVLKEGAWSKELQPIFPSITFPAHVTEATGVPVATHGIPGNTFYDGKQRKLLKYPWDASLLEAEPIWLTAKRQGVRTAVIDWPLSHAQQGAVRADYFGEKFEGALSDEERLNRLLAIYRDDKADAPLQLLMGYAVATDAVGHQKGPDSEEITAQIAKVDAFLGATVEAFRTHWSLSATPQDTLYVILSTDHGMATVTDLMNIEKVLPEPRPEGVQIATNGPIADIHLSDIADPALRARTKAEYLSLLGKREELSTFARENLPPDWQYNHPTRTGDIVAVLKNGWTFSRQMRQPIFTIDQAGGPKGMHGYDVRTCPEMKGFLGILRYPAPLGGRDMGPVSSLQLHPTVAQLLGVQPALAAKAPPIPLSAPPN